VESFSKIAIEEGFEPTTKVIDIKELQVSQNLTELLGTKKALFVKRVRFLDNDPVMLENNYFPLPRFKEFSKFMI
uniref:UTRA domain-containing protein n=1 Tax=Liquorilactobacillus vini TaxID=238015 RepID=UPI0005549859